MDTAHYLQFILALVFVLALIGLLALVARRLGLGGIPPATRGHGRRLAVVEVRTLDARRRLLLVRRDRVEHLVILGPSSELLVESGIPAPADDFSRTLGQATDERR
ncbi:MAG: hypothetical protein EA406_00675 [Rhodospirillales bacterium]|nr:MAG: hypothetical protein EA406_00675 [Rhodospirillales bacterium]